MKQLLGLIGALALISCSPPQENESPIPEEAPADAPPSTDIYVASLTTGDEGLSVSDAQRVTEGGGYDNQPYFLNGEDSFYFVSEGESGKTDLWRHDIATNSNTRITDTPLVSEYSPKPAPGDYGVSYIQETDISGEITKVYHTSPQFPDGAAVSDFQPLGYYAWLDDGRKLGVYLRNEPGELHLVDIESGDTTMIASGIGRSLQPSPDGRELYFTVADETGVQTVTVYDLDDGSVSTIVAMLPDMQDFWALFDDEGNLESILAGSGSQLFQNVAGDDPSWRLVHDFAAQGLSGLTRLSVSDDSDTIALVFDE